MQRALDCFSMFRPSAIKMVHRKELRFHFAAASALWRIAAIVNQTSHLNPLISGMVNMPYSFLYLWTTPVGFLICAYFIGIFSLIIYPNLPMRNIVLFRVHSYEVNIVSAFSLNSCVRMPSLSPGFGTPSNLQSLKPMLTSVASSSTIVTLLAVPFLAAANSPVSLN